MKGIKETLETHIRKMDWLEALESDMTQLEYAKLRVKVVEDLFEALTRQEYKEVLYKDIADNLTPNKE